MKTPIPAIAILTLLFFIRGEAAAQYGTVEGDGITADGSAEIELRPAVMKLTIQVEGRSSDLPQAATELKRRIDVAKARLKKLNADDASVTISKPRLQTGAGSENAEAMEMMMQQYGGGSRGRKMLEQTQSVSIVQTISAQWPLADEGDDYKRLITAHELTAKIRAADIASAGEKQPVSAAQQELAVEMEAMMDQYSYGEQTEKVGEPTFTYIALLEADRHRELIGRAFESAKAEIERLAESTKTRIEPVRVTSSMMQFGEQGEYAQYAQYGRGNSGPSGRPDQSGNYEIAGDDPNVVQCHLRVSAIGLYKPSN